MHFYWTVSVGYVFFDILYHASLFPVGDYWFLC